MKVNGMQILDNIDNIQFKELKELDQILMLKQLNTKESNILYNNFIIMTLKSIIFDSIYVFNNLDTNLECEEDEYYEEGPEDEDGFYENVLVPDKYENNIYYDPKEYINGYVLLNKEKNIYIEYSDMIEEVIRYNIKYYSLSQFLSTYIRDNLMGMKNNSFTTSYNVYKYENKIRSINRTLYYKLNSNYLLVNFSHEINKERLGWTKTIDVKMYDSTLYKCITIKCDNKKLMKKLEEISKIIGDEKTFDEFSQKVYKINKYSFAEIVKDNSKLDDIKWFILNGKKSVGNITEEDLEEYFKYIYVNDEINFKSYKMNFGNSIQIGYDCRYDLNEEEKSILSNSIKVGKAILEYKCNSNLINPYTGNLLNDKFVVKYIDDEGIIIADNTYANIHIKKDALNSVYASKIRIYKKMFDVYVKLEDNELSINKIWLDDLFDRYKLVRTLEG